MVDVNPVCDQVSKDSELNQDDLRCELAKLRQQLEEEKSASKQAAEYGLSLLEEFKKIQTRNYELEDEIQNWKIQLDNANLVITYLSLLNYSFFQKTYKIFN